jgi:hypothetical protein
MRSLVNLIFVLFVIYFLSEIIKRCSGNCKHINSLRPSVRKNFTYFLEDAKKHGYYGVITSSERTYQEQEYYYKKDKRNAPPGSSSHELRNAIDVDFYNKNGKLLLTKSTLKNSWSKSGLPQLAKEYGINWGGTFKNYADNNHFYYG